MTLKHYKFLLVVFTLFITASVEARLLISPYRAVLSDKNRSQAITVVNTTTSTMSYNLSWAEFAQTPDGKYDTLSEPSAHSASKHLKFSPKRVTLKPGEKQTVRVYYKPKTELNNGEFRSHLKLGAEPLPKKEAGDDNAKGAALKLNLNLSFTIPIIIRVGAPQIQNANIDSVQIAPSGSDGLPVLKATISKEGNYSSYGSIYAYMQEKPGLPVIKIGESNNVAIFRELKQRSVIIQLQKKNIPPGAAIKLSYEGKGDYTGQTFAQKVFKYQP